MGMGVAGETMLRRVSQRAFDHWERFAASRRATATMCLWAAAEATVWPILPDFLLVPLAAGNRARFHVPLAACVLGSSLGGLAIFALAYLAPRQAAELLAALPLIPERHVLVVHQELEARGAAAFLAQPWSGISFKVWALLSPVHEISPWLAFSASVAARTARMLLGATVSRMLAGRFHRVLRDFSIPVALAYLLIFAIVLWHMLS